MEKFTFSTEEENRKAFEESEKLLDYVFSIYDEEKKKENFSSREFWQEVEDWSVENTKKLGITNFSDFLNRIQSLSWNSWRKEQLQQIEELEKDLPEFKKDK